MSGPAPEFYRILEAARPRECVWRGAVPFARGPLAVGQWAEYLVVDGDREPLRVRLTVTAEEGETFRLRGNVMPAAARPAQGAPATDVGGAGIARGPRNAELVIKAARDSSALEVERPAIPVGASAPSDPESSLGSGPVPWFLAESLGARVSADRPLVITAPAGTFENTVKRRLTVKAPRPSVVHEWLNDKVPIAGVVKAETEDGMYRQVLLDFYTGADEEGEKK